LHGFLTQVQTQLEITQSVSTTMASEITSLMSLPFITMHHLPQVKLLAALFSTGYCQIHYTVHAASHVSRPQKLPAEQEQPPA